MLEGEEHRVDACFERVSRDTRHGRVKVLARDPASSRTFSKWLMGYENPKDLGFVERQHALSIEDVKARLDAVADLDTSEGRKTTIREMTRFLTQAQFARAG